MIKNIEIIKDVELCTKLVIDYLHSTDFSEEIYLSSLTQIICISASQIMPEEYFRGYIDKMMDSFREYKKLTTE